MNLPEIFICARRAPVASAVVSVYFAEFVQESRERAKREAAEFLAGCSGVARCGRTHNRADCCGGPTSAGQPNAGASTASGLSPRGASRAAPVGQLKQVSSPAATPEHLADFLANAERKASPRRFSGAPVTGFGDMA